MAGSAASGHADAVDPAVPGALADFVPVNAVARPLDQEDVPSDQVAEGAPRTGLWEIVSSPTLSVGVWEMTAGAMRDVEADELFIVIDGAGTVTAFDPDGGTRTIRLRAGSLCRLEAGTVTRWDVPQRLRKLYIQPVPGSAAAGEDER